MYNKQGTCFKQKKPFDAVELHAHERKSLETNACFHRLYIVIRSRQQLPRVSDNDKLN